MPEYEVDILVSHPTTVRVEAETEVDAKAKALAGEGAPVGVDFTDSEVIDVREVERAGGPVDDDLQRSGDPLFYVDGLQAVEPDELEEAEGIRVDVWPELDSMGFGTVSVYGPSRDAVVEYVRLQWGDEDPVWFAEYVVGRVREA